MRETPVTPAARGPLPLRFVFGLHLHQPVGNFDAVFESHVHDVYQPLLDTLMERQLTPIALHVSGPLLDWLEAHDPAWLDRLARWAGDGQLELLCAGYYEPILAALPPEDRREQIAWMRETVRRRFGVEASGLWLTERVWEPDLPADLAAAGVRYAFVDDRHFLVSGFPRERLYAPFRTEFAGRRIGLFSIDERLRYLIPFRPPAEAVAYLRSLRAAGHPLAVLADDGEKFGGWPGTRSWVWDQGWLWDFLDAMRRLVDAGELELVTPTRALAEIPTAGLAYLPTASYREMEGWALPPAAATRLAALERELGERFVGPEGDLIRGGHWRHFLIRYPEAGRMHRKMLALSALSRQRGDPPAVRRAVGRAQCNDAYWHGVFGGLYLPHLRQAVWRNLAAAERELRRGEPPAVERLDQDGDGVDELWVHSARWSALISPARGGAIEELTALDAGLNFVDVITRRREAYHVTRADAPVGAEGGVPSIHALEHAARLDVLPPVDPDTRVLVIERVLPTTLRRETYERGEFVPLRSWAQETFTARIDASGAGVEVLLRAPGLGKRYRFPASGPIVLEYRWDPAAVGSGWFAPEVSLAHPATVRFVPDGETWEYDIVTVAKSERGFEETVQGRSLTVRWPVEAGSGRIELSWDDEAV
jgi:4-alpha-glucanotransferase